MIFLLILAGVFVAFVTSETLIELAAGGAFFAFFIALAVGDFGAAAFALAVVAICCWRWATLGRVA